jgi:Flp pilus assembly pilin Flp
MSVARNVLAVRRGYRGQTMTEYALILVTVAAVAVALFQNAGTILTAIVNQVGPLL